MVAEECDRLSVTEHLQIHFYYIMLLSPLQNIENTVGQYTG